jgi:hypothetical protein
MENFDKFYENIDINELKKLIEEKRLNQSNLYDFLTGFSYYLKQQENMDRF